MDKYLLKEFDSFNLQSIVIEEHIQIESKFLDLNIEHHLKNNILKDKNKCFKRYGFVYPIFTKFVFNNVNELFFMVEYDAKILKPEIGRLLIAVVTKIIPNGVFLRVKSLTIFIPSKSLDFWYDNNKETFVQCKKGLDTPKEEICIDSLIQTKITFVQYNVNTYCVLGEFVKFVYI